ncbi:MAG: ribbon-helix-helix protein, CopG family [Sphingomonadales bacterium]|nr:ribbon-helix-helix protein, CopG family [Sphingomonadales bacterium]
MTLTVRLTRETKDRLDALALSARRSKTFLAAEAIDAYVAANAWQVEEGSRRSPYLSGGQRCQIVYLTEAAVGLAEFLHLRI